MDNTLENALAFMHKTNRSTEDITNVEMMVAYASQVQGKWIKVDDELPEMGRKVLVAYMPPSPLMERWTYTVTNRVDVPKGSIYARMMDNNHFRIDGLSSKLHHTIINLKQRSPL